MKNFKIRLLFTHTPADHSNPMNVILNDDFNGSVGMCDISYENNEVMGYFSLQVEVPDTMFVYYRHTTPENFYYAIQLRETRYPDQGTFTIAALTR